MKAILRWLERLAWIAVLVFVAHRLWPQVAAVAGVGGDLGIMPSFTLETLDGKVVTSEDLAGQVVLVNFWATWCPPCRLEMPGFQRVYERERDRGFVLLGISTDRGGAAAVRRFLEEREIRYPVALAAGGVERAFGGIRGLPTSFIVDRAGRIRYRVYGFFAPPAMARAVDRLLDEPQTGGKSSP